MAVNLNRFNINYTKLVNERIPEPIRMPKMQALFLVLAGPFVELYNKLLLFRDLVVYKLTITPQVCFLEKMLNDRYDNIQRRIYILDGKDYPPSYLYLKAELQPLYLYRKSENQPIYLYRKGETGAGTFDFVVYVPSDITFDGNEMSSLIDSYKLASKLFDIQIF